MEIKFRLTIIILSFNLGIYSQNNGISKEYIENNLISRGFNDVTFLDKNNNTSYFHALVPSSDSEKRPIIIAIHKLRNNEPILNIIEDAEYTEQKKKYYPNQYDSASYYKYVNWKEEEDFLLELIESSDFSVIESDYLKRLGKNNI